MKISNFQNLDPSLTRVMHEVELSTIAESIFSPRDGHCARSLIYDNEKRQVSISSIISVLQRDIQLDKYSYDLEG